MSLIAYLVITFGYAGLAIALRGRRRWAIVVGLTGLTAAIVAALAMDPAETIVIGGGGLVTTTYLRLFLVLGSVVGLALAVGGLASGTRRDATAVTLAILGTCGLTMALVDPRAAVLVATAGALFGVLVTLVPNGGRAGAAVGIREIRAVVVAGSLAIAATAWIGRDLSQLSAQPVVFGLAYLAFAVAVAMRFGAIPFHLWAARLTDVVPETALPILTALAPAAFAVVALAWIDASVAPLPLDLSAERALILAVGISSIVLAAIAAFVQDDIEHVLGYSIVGDAGVIVLSLATLGPDGWIAARTWILGFVVARSAFAAWTAAIRAGFFTGRIADLRGWARRSPVLVVALGLVIVASVGLPGLAAFDARASVVNLAIGAPLSILVQLATLAPLLYYGRLLVIGLASPERMIGPADAWRPHIDPPDVTAVRRWILVSWNANHAFTTAWVAALLGLLALATAGGAFGGPAAAAGLPPTMGVPGEIGSPTGSGEPPIESVGP
ncbi:MAG: NADH-quinone oxidoreductase subunit [Chloroflexota bacterium]|nr:NADH-quinone oxidoreductase subunit [Chloroflexota bacterium]